MKRRLPTSPRVPRTRPDIALGPNHDLLIPVFRNDLPATVAAVKELSRTRLEQIARAWGMQIGRWKLDRELMFAVMGKVQLEWFKFNKKEITAKMENEQEVREENLAKDNSGETTATGKDRKPRELKKFVFNWDEELATKAKINSKKGQYKLVVDILNDPKNEGNVWDAASLAEAIMVHPELRTTSAPLKIANYYIFELRNTGLIKQIKD